MVPLIFFLISAILNTTIFPMEKTSDIPQVTQVASIHQEAPKTIQIYSNITENSRPTNIDSTLIKHSLTLETMFEVSEKKDAVYLDFPQEHIVCIALLLEDIEIFYQREKHLPSKKLCILWIINYTENFKRISFIDMLNIILFFDIRILFDALLEIEHPIPLPKNHAEEIAYNKQLMIIFKLAHQSSIQEYQIGHNAIWSLLGRMLYPGCLHYPKIRRHIEAITGKYINPVSEKICSIPHISKNKVSVLPGIEEIVLGAYMQEHPHLYNNHLRTYNKNIDDIKAIIHCQQSNHIMVATKNTIQKIDIKKNKSIYSKIIPDYINVATLSPNGEYSAAGLEYNDSIKIAHIQTKTSKELRGHAGIISALSFSPNTHLIASGSWDNTIRLWDVEKGNSIHIFTEHTDAIDCVTFSPNSTVLASGSRDNTVRIWDIQTKACIRTLPCPDYVYALAFNKTGSILAAGCNDGSLILWNIIDGSVIYRIKAHSDRITCIAFSPHDNLIATGSYDHTIRLYEVSTGAIYQTINAHNDFVSSITFSPHGTYIISGGWDNIIQIYGQTSLLQALTDTEEV